MRGRTFVDNFETLFLWGAGAGLQRAGSTCHVCAPHAAYPDWSRMSQTLRERWSLLGEWFRPRDGRDLEQTGNRVLFVCVETNPTSRILLWVECYGRRSQSDWERFTQSGRVPSITPWIKAVLNYSLSVPEIYQYTCIFPSFLCFLNHYNRR